MRSAAAAVVILFAAAGVHAQQKHAGARPAPATSQGPPPSPFAAGPDTYAPHYDRPAPSRHRGGIGYGVPIYSVPGMEPAPPAAAKASPPAAAPAPPAPPAPEPPKIVEPLPEPSRVTAAHGPDTFYVIPGCYAGNRPPIPDRLPNGCDPEKMRTTPVR